MREPAFWHRPSSWTSHLLRPLGTLYGAVAAQRLQRKGFDAGIPVLCVGNYHLGGAGKTPAVLALAKLLRELGESPVVLSRGYGGRLRGPVMVDPARHGAADVGDEPLMLASYLPVAVARDRVDGVALARSQRASMILMDDGFQNPAIAKDASLIVIDANRGVGNGEVFPAGPLRAPLPPQIARTDALIVVGEGTGSKAIAAEIATRGGLVLVAHLKPEAQALARLAGKRVLAFAGIGDPARFFRTLRSHGVEVVRERAFADHHGIRRCRAPAGVPVGPDIQGAREAISGWELAFRLQHARIMPLQHRGRQRIGLLQVDAPVFQLVERDPNVGHRAAHIGSRRGHAEIAVQILHLRFAMARGAEFIQQCRKLR